MTSSCEETGHEPRPGRDEKPAALIIASFRPLRETQTEERGDMNLAVETESVRHGRRDATGSTNTAHPQHPASGWPMPTGASRTGNDIGEHSK